MSITDVGESKTKYTRGNTWKTTISHNKGNKQLVIISKNKTEDKAVCQSSSPQTDNSDTYSFPTHFAGMW